MKYAFEHSASQLIECLPRARTEPAHTHPSLFRAHVKRVRVGDVVFRVGVTVSSSLSRDSWARSNSLPSLYLSPPLSQLLERGINSCKVLSSTIIPSFPPTTIIPFRSRPSNRPWPSSLPIPRCQVNCQRLRPHHPEPGQPCQSYVSAEHLYVLLATHRSHSVCRNFVMTGPQKLVVLRSSGPLTFFVLILYWFYTLWDSLFFISFLTYFIFRSHYSRLAMSDYTRIIAMPWFEYSVWGT